MTRTPAKRSSLFLLELIIAILFFSLASAVCVRFFVKAHTISRDAVELNNALEKVSGYAEVFLAADSFSAYIEDYTDGQLVAENDSEYLIYYNSDWEICGSADASYTIEIQISENGSLEHALFTAYRLSDTAADSEIYSLETDRYSSGEEAV